MLQNIRKNRGGFTLVEIMIVVAIIALLAAIAVPGFLRARKRSQATAILNDARIIDGALDQYAIENNKVGSATVTARTSRASSSPVRVCICRPAARQRAERHPRQQLLVLHLRRRRQGQHGHLGELHGRDRHGLLLLGRLLPVSFRSTSTCRFPALPQRPFGSSPKGRLLFQGSEGNQVVIALYGTSSFRFALPNFYLRLLSRCPPHCSPRLDRLPFDHRMTPCRWINRSLLHQPQAGRDFALLVLMAAVLTAYALARRSIPVGRHGSRSSITCSSAVPCFAGKFSGTLCSTASRISTVPPRRSPFIANYWFWALDPFGYHLTSILIHAANAFLLFLVLRRVLADAAPRPETRLESAPMRWRSRSHSIWAFHPVHSAAVAYVSGSADSLAMLFCLTRLAVLRTRARHRPDRGRRLALGGRCAFAALLLGLCSKEIAFIWLVIFSGCLFGLAREGNGPPRQVDGRRGRNACPALLPRPASPAARAADAPPPMPPLPAKGCADDSRAR